MKLKTEDINLIEHALNMARVHYARQNKFELSNAYNALQANFINCQESLELGQYRQTESATYELKLVLAPVAKRIHNVAVGDRFQAGKHCVSVVVDILEKRSMSGEVVDHECIAKPEGSLATNEYPVPFSTVVRNRIKP